MSNKLNMLKSIVIFVMFIQLIVMYGCSKNDSTVGDEPDVKLSTITNGKASENPMYVKAGQIVLFLSMDERYTISMPTNSVNYEREKPTPAAFIIAERDSYPDTVSYKVYNMAVDPIVPADAPAMIVEGPSTH